MFLQTCCEGVLHDNKQGYECCGTHYIPRRHSLDDVCCGGQFYTKLANHQCCGGRFVLSLKFDIGDLTLNQQNYLVIDGLSAMKRFQILCITDMLKWMKTRFVA